MLNKYLANFLFSDQFEHSLVNKTLNYVSFQRLMILSLTTFALVEKKKNIFFSINVKSLKSFTPQMIETVIIGT